MLTLPGRVETKTIFFIDILYEEIEAMMNIYRCRYGAATGNDLDDRYSPLGSNRTVFEKMR
jgi:hypothetical protein